MPVHPRVPRQRTLKEVLNGRVVREIVSEASEQPPCVGIHDKTRTEKGVDEDDVCRLRAHAADGEQFFAQFFRGYARGVLPLEAVFSEPRRQRPDGARLSPAKQMCIRDSYNTVWIRRCTMDVFVEQVVSRKRRGLYDILFYGCWALLVACGLVGRCV